MNILFLGYWNADDPLTSATIIPHLKILGEINNGKLVFSSVQRQPSSKKIINSIKETGAQFQPLYSRNLPINVLNKFWDFVSLPFNIKKLIESENVHLIIARGAPAGALAYLATKVNKIPFIVESYEPHSDYMKETGVWLKYDPRYIMQSYWEKKINQKANYLLTVSENYKKKLIQAGVNESKIEVARCAVDDKRFTLNKNINLRKELNIPENAIVGIYAGKFGGLYYDRDTFQLIKYFDEYYGTLHFILLSDISDEKLNKYCFEFDLDKNKIHKFLVPHDKVNYFLNTADFAIATYRKTPSAGFLSPVKLGEYWGTGLPTLLTQGVGDESNIIESKRLGVSFDMEKINNLQYRNEKLNSFNKIILSKDKNYIRNFAIKYRSFDSIRNKYVQILANS